MTDRIFIVPEDVVEKVLHDPIPMEEEMAKFFGKPLLGTEKTITYTIGDIDTIEDELARFIDIETEKNRVVSPGEDQIFVYTTGGPGSGKNYYLETKTEAAWADRCYTDPDETVMKRLKPYLDIIEAEGDTEATRVKAYTFNRWASQYINNSMLNHAAREGWNIVFGTTGTGPAMKHMLGNARNSGLVSEVHMLHAPEQVRLDSVQKRFEETRRFTPEDHVKDKGNVLFPERLPVHFEHADQFDLLWRPDMTTTVLAAKGHKDGQIEILDPSAVKEFFNEVGRAKPEISWKAMAKLFTESRAAQQKQVAAKPRMTVKPN